MRSSYAEAAWERARRKLDAAGFAEEDALAVLRAAFFNSLEPERFTRAAIQLREHVLAGKPLS